MAEEKATHHTGDFTAQSISDMTGMADTTDTTTSLLSLDDWKGLSMCVFTVLSILAFVAAIVMREHTRPVFASSGVLFSAGVLIAAGFVHLLSDSNQSFDDLGHDTKFPWAFAVAGVTTVCLACVEMAVAGVLGGMHNRKIKNMSNNASSSSEASSNGATHAVQETKDQGSNKGTSNASDLEIVESQPVETLCNSTHGNEKEVAVATEDHEIEPWVGVILTIALNIHCIIEGIGIGAMDNVSDIQSMFVAIAFHKAFAAYALANSLICGGFWQKVIAVGFTFRPVPLSS